MFLEGPQELLSNIWNLSHGGGRRLLYSSRAELVLIEITHEARGWKSDKYWARELCPARSTKQWPRARESQPGRLSRWEGGSSAQMPRMSTAASFPASRGRPSPLTVVSPDVGSNSGWRGGLADQFGKVVVQSWLQLPPIHWLDWEKPLPA